MNTDFSIVFCRNHPDGVQPLTGSRMFGGNVSVFAFGDWAFERILDLQDDDVGGGLQDLKLHFPRVVLYGSAAMESIFQQISQQHAEIDITDSVRIRNLNIELGLDIF